MIIVYLDVPLHKVLELQDWMDSNTPNWFYVEAHERTVLYYRRRAKTAENTIRENWPENIILKFRCHREYMLFKLTWADYIYHQKEEKAELTS